MKRWMVRAKVRLPNKRLSDMNYVIEEAPGPEEAEAKFHDFLVPGSEVLEINATCIGGEDDPLAAASPETPPGAAGSPAAETADSGGEPKGEPPAAMPPEPPAVTANTPLDELGFGLVINRALGSFGLTTAGQIAAYVKEHGSLPNVAGIGPAEVQHLLASIKRWKLKAE